jgi:phosphoglycolate phosphatase
VGNLHRLIVFDLDGTLVDSREDLTDAANALIVERGGQPLEDHAVAKMIGEGAGKLVQRALSAAGLEDEGAPALRRFLELYDERLLAKTRPYPGIPEVLEELSHRAQLAVLTNKPTAPTKVLLDGLGLSRFFAIALGGDGPFPRKPDPVSLWHLMSTYQAHARDTVLVGDSRIDFATARAAGTDVCMTRYGFGYENFPVAELTGEEALVDRALDIPRALEEVRRRSDGS